MHKKTPERIPVKLAVSSVQVLPTRKTQKKLCYSKAEPYNPLKSKKSSPQKTHHWKKKKKVWLAQRMGTKSESRIPERPRKSQAMCNRADGTF